MHIIIGLIVLAAGLFMTLSTENMLRGFGRLPFFENHFGTEGGSRFGYKAIGIIAIFLGLIILFDMHQGFLSWALGPIIRPAQKVF